MTRKILLWKGFHDPALARLIHESWTREDLLILCPPFLKDLSFVRNLPPGPIQLLGDWGTEVEVPVCTRPWEGPSSERVFLKRAVLGVFTSGTVSGKPRLVLYSKSAIESSIGAILEVFKAKRIQTVFSYPQPFHCFGLILGYVLPMLQGYERVELTGKYSSQFHSHWLNRTGAGFLTLGTPTHFHDLLHRIKREGLQPGASYSCIVGGAKVSVALWRAIRDLLHVEAPSIGYGASEASPGVMHHPPGREPSEDGEIGFPLRGVQVRLRPGRGLEFQGPNRCLALIEDGRIEFPERILLTDEIRVRADGMHVYQSRTELMLNRGGEKFSLEKIQEALKSALQLESLCVALPHPRLGEELGVLLRSSDPSSLGRRPLALPLEVQKVLELNLHQRFESGVILEVGEFPLNANSKIDRGAAKELLLRASKLAELPRLVDRA